MNRTAEYSVQTRPSMALRSAPASEALLQRQHSVNGEERHSESTGQASQRFLHLQRTI